MERFVLFSKMEKLFEFSSTVSIIIFIVSSLISIAIFAGIIFAIVKTVKGVKNGTIKLKSLESVEEDPNFTSCEYCGSSNKLDNISCEKCGASLKRK